MEGHRRGIGGKIFITLEHDYGSSEDIYYILIYPKLFSKLPAPLQIMLAC